MTRLLSFQNSLDDLGQVTGLIVYYAVGADERTLFLSVGEIGGLSPAQIRNLAQQRADADPGQAGPSREREDILPNDLSAMIETAQGEIDYLDTTIPTIDAMTAAQVRSVVKRLAQENRAIIKALIRLAYQI